MTINEVLLNLTAVCVFFSKVMFPRSINTTVLHSLVIPLSTLPPKIANQFLNKKDYMFPLLMGGT